MNHTNQEATVPDTVTDQTLIPNADAKPKRTRKPRAPKAQAAPKKERAKPKTLAAQVRAMGPHHTKALEILGSAFKDELRTALCATRDYEKAVARKERAFDEHEKAERALLAAEEAQTKAETVRARLDECAAQVASFAPKS